MFEWIQQMRAILLIIEKRKVNIFFCKKKNNQTKTKTNWNCTCPRVWLEIKYSSFLIWQNLLEQIVLKWSIFFPCTVSPPTTTPSTDCNGGPRTFSGQCCSIPFTYNGARYNACTEADHSTLWCSLDPVYKGNWGDCRKFSLSGQIPFVPYSTFEYIQQISADITNMCLLVSLMFW